MVSVMISTFKVKTQHLARHVHSKEVDSSQTDIKLSDSDRQLTDRILELNHPKGKSEVIGTENISIGIVNQEYKTDILPAVESTFWIKGFEWKGIYLKLMTFNEAIQIEENVSRVSSLYYKLMIDNNFIEVDDKQRVYTIPAI